DSDGDTYGDISSTTQTCDLPSGYVSDDTDCDDGAAAVNPAATEVCDSIDNDCDTLIDDDDGSLDASTGTTWYADSDGDTYGDISSTTQTCDLPSGYVSDDDDCDDGDATQYPGADEYCNSEDDDCDGTTDEDAVDGSDFYIDDDEDGFGDPTVTEWACDGITNNYDCNDTDSAEPVMVDISTGSASGAGTIDDPLDAIQDGIDSANECVVVAGGTYSEAIDFSGKDLEVTGVDGPDNTIIDASGLGTPVVTFASGEQGWLEGFTLLSGDGYLESTSSSYACTSITTCTDYYDTYAGGGIYIDGADPTVVNVIIEANYLPTASTTVSGNDTYYVNSFGGGIYISSGTLIADGLAILENEADQGGGVYLDPSSVLTMDASWVIGNGAEDGGGVEVDGGDAQLTNVASIWNMADSDGGGILLIDAALEATNVMWGGDDATTGGGLYATGTSSATVMNSIITESGSAEGVLVGGSASFSGSYNNVYNNAGGDYSGISDPTGSSGNLSTSVGFSAWSDDGTYTNENISLTTSSAMIGAGNPSSTYDNADGTTNDIGALGGPSSDWDDGVPGLN
ncbi:MAG: hypothetical protein GY901_12575, partial [Actinomycetia bacterium]|nr:hypothetical protein [Actinomycetes bacterium]